MTPQPAVGAHPGSHEGGLGEYRRQLLLFLAVFTFYGALLMILWITDPRTPVMEGVGVILAALFLAVAVYFLRRSFPLLAGYCYVVASLVVDVFVLRIFGHGGAMALFLLPVLLSGLLMGNREALITGLLTIALLVYLNETTSHVEDLLLWIMLVVAMSGISMLTAWGLELIDFWERELTRRYDQLVDELRTHQGELNRTVKALEEAYHSLRRTNEELIAARREAEEARAFKEQFVANVSHELRTPLNLIVGFSEMMYLSPKSYEGVIWTPTLVGDMQEVYRASRHLQSLVNDILDLSRIDVERLPMFREIQDIRAIIDGAVETIAPLLRQHGLEHEVEYPDELPSLFVDRTRIRQVMLNLLNNAARYTDEGCITIRVRQDEETAIVSVQDTGLGIPEDQKEYIFEEFHQIDAGLRRRGGAGLGLALSRQFISLHGGRMWVESEVGVGSTFYFSLPLPGSVYAAQLRHLPDRRQADLSHVPLLVVEPDPSIAEMISRYLDDRPVIPVQELDQVEALIERERPLAVIVNLPPEAPSEEWLGPLGKASERYDVPIVRCALPSPSWLQRAVGLDGCLTKPISFETLERTLQQHFTEPSTVLVVDDDPGFVRLMTRMLGKTPVVDQVLTAYSGAQALRITHAQVPDLVLLDLRMPELDGLAVLSEWRSDPRTSDICVVAVTATSYVEEVLHQKGHYFTISQSRGLSSGTLVELINASLRMLHPDYVPEASSRARA